MSKEEKSFRDKVQIYLDNYTKRQLAMMLVLRDSEKNPSPTTPVTAPHPAPSIPYVDDNMWRPCKTWEDCTNPHYDCINCPLRSFPPRQKYILTKQTLTQDKPHPFPTTITCYVTSEPIG